jgi:hypothetical protein
MVEIKKISVEEARRLLKEHPSKRPGRWDEVFSRVLSSDQPIIVKGLSRGSAWHLRRRAKELGLFARVIGGDTVVLSKESLE